jgi:hypothetical protein
MVSVCPVDFCALNIVARHASVVGVSGRTGHVFLLWLCWSKRRKQSASFLPMPEDSTTGELILPFVV